MTQRKHIIQLVFVIALAALLLTNLPTWAQGQNTLTLFQTVTAELAAGSTDTWTFGGQSGQVISLYAQSAGDLDPVLTLLDGSGRTLLTNDDYAYPDTRDALLQAVALPITGTYSVQVSGFGETSGEYELTLSSGFATITDAVFEDEADWQADAPLQAEVVDGQLALQVQTNGETHTAFNDALVEADMAARVHVVSVENAGGNWIVGMAAREQGNDYYRFSVNEQGLWRFTLVQNGDEVILHDWVAHPNIVPGQFTFTLGMTARGSAFEFFVNDGFIGSVADATLMEAGSFGLTAGAQSGTPSNTQVTYDNLVLTTPLQTPDGAIVIPNQVLVGVPLAMVNTLSLRHLLDANGTMALTVPETTANAIRPGVSTIGLGQGATFSNFALGGYVNISTSRAGLGGCGLQFRASGENEYAIAYLDTSGAYGLSRRDGEVFSEGLFGENATFAGGGRHHLLVIASETTLYLYVDGQLAGSTPDTAQAGTIGAAVVNFESIETTCRFENLWLWRWEG